MGRSKSINTLAENNKEFQNYLDSLKTQLLTKSDDEKKKMDDAIEKYYKDNNYTKKEYIVGMNSDFLQKQEWSLDNVKEIINVITKAMFGETTPPNGVTVNTSTEVSAAIKQMADLKTYLLGKSFEIISGAIDCFGSSSEVHYNTQYKEEPLGNGFHLFSTVVCDSFKTKDFFNNQEIYEYLYIYRICFSTEEAADQGKIMAIETYENQIAVYSRKIEQYLDQLSNDQITIEQYKTYKDSYQDLIDESQKKLNELKSNQLKAERAKELKIKEEKANIFL